VCVYGKECLPGDEEAVEGARSSSSSSSTSLPEPGIWVRISSFASGFSRILSEESERGEGERRGSYLVARLQRYPIEQSSCAFFLRPMMLMLRVWPFFFFFFAGDTLTPPGATVV
jgi:hypothetical protein